jgi:hypothetical protein
MNRPLEKRLRALRSRAAIRAWEYRQRSHAKGVWFRLRRLLADASAAYVLGERSVRDLLSEGYQPEPVGEALEPPKVILSVPAERLEGVVDKDPIPVRLRAAFLAARYVALVRFKRAEED